MLVLKLLRICEMLYHSDVLKTTSIWRGLIDVWSSISLIFFFSGTGDEAQVFIVEDEDFRFSFWPVFQRCRIFCKIKMVIFSWNVSNSGSKPETTRLIYSFVRKKEDPTSWTSLVLRVNERRNPNLIEWSKAQE